MTWEDTVIDTIPIIDKWLSGELESRHAAPAIAEAQAKATWDAAIKEVVEWIAENRIVSLYWQWEDNENWQAQQKEWLGESDGSTTTG